MIDNKLLKMNMNIYIPSDTPVNGATLRRRVSGDALSGPSTLINADVDGVVFGVADDVSSLLLLTRSHHG